VLNEDKVFLNANQNQLKSVELYFVFETLFPVRNLSSTGDYYSNQPYYLISNYKIFKNILNIKIKFCQFRKYNIFVNGS